MHVRVPTNEFEYTTDLKFGSPSLIAIREQDQNIDTSIGRSNSNIIKYSDQSDGEFGDPQLMPPMSHPPSLVKLFDSQLTNDEDFDNDEEQRCGEFAVFARAGFEFLCLDDPENLVSWDCYH